MTTSPHTPYILEEEEETDVEENMEETVENQVPSPSSPHTPIESIREHKQERDIEELREGDFGTIQMEDSRNNSS